MFTLWPEKIHTRNLITKQNFLRLENFPPPPPITFLMVRPLEGSLSLALPPAENIKNFKLALCAREKKLSSTLGKFTSFLARQVWTWVVKRSTSLIDLDLQQCFACDVGYVFSNLFGVSNQPPSLESYFRFSSFYTSSNADLVGFIGLSKSRLVGKSTSLSCFVISSPGRFSHLQSHGKAPWGRGWSCSKR